MQRSLATPLARSQIFVRVQDHSAFRQDSQLVAALPRDGKDIRLLINGAASCPPPPHALSAALVVAGQGPLWPLIAHVPSWEAAHRARCVTAVVPVQAT